MNFDTPAFEELKDRERQHALSDDEGDRQFAAGIRDAMTVFTIEALKASAEPSQPHPGPYGGAAMTHELKTDPLAFDALAAGLKTHEVRFNDRAFQSGHLVLLRRTLNTGEEMRAGAPLIFTGEELLRTITHVQAGYGLADGWVILSLSKQQPAAAAMVDGPAQSGTMDSAEASRLIDPEDLQNAGFLPVRYAFGGPTFHRRDTAVGSMPYLGKQIDGETIIEDSVVVTEVSHLGLVTVRIDSTGYAEEPVSINTDDAQAALLDSIAGTLDQRELNAIRVDTISSNHGSL